MTFLVEQLDDTIVAISTPPGRGGIGIIRLSGARALSVALTFFRFGENQTVLPLAEVTPRMAHRGWVVDPTQADKLVDDGLLLYFQAPNSFTGEDVVELQLHGSPRGLERILGMLIRFDASGVRLATAGEFSRRALIHGRIDLAQAEAIIDLIDAKTSRSAELAAQQLLGQLGQKVQAVRERLLGWFAQLEALLDFPEDQVPEIEEATFDQTIETETLLLKRILQQSEHAWIYREGLRVAIVGAPNMGKSSLFNRLLRRDRAIVSAISGTTRDVIEEAVDIDGVPVIFSDTAGITKSEDVLEQMGMARSIAAIEGAELLVVVLDASDPQSTLEGFLSSLEPAVQAVVGSKRQLVVWNKAESIPLPKASEGALWISVQTDLGIEALQQAIVAAYKLDETENEALIVTNLRQRLALHSAAEALERLSANRQSKLGWDVVAYELRESIEQLGLVTGASVDQELHQEIFGRFCIGK